MKKLIKRIIILLLFLLMIDGVFGVFFRYLITISPDGRYFKANHSISNCHEKLIIFGSSRAESNYAPYVFEDSLNLSTWNTGRGGQSLPFWYAMELGILDDNIPQIAVINIESDFLSYDMKDSYQRAGFLKPFYFSHKEIRPVIDKISDHEKYLMFSNIYSFNSSFYYLIRPFFVKGLDGRGDLKGWKTRDGSTEKSENNYSIYNSDRKLNKETLELFRQFIKNLTTKGCKVYIVVSPNYNTLVKYSPTINYISNMKEVNLIDYSNNKMFVDNNKYYIDPDHMNIDGAIQFSKNISHIIKNTLYN